MGGGFIAGLLEPIGGQIRQNKQRKIDEDWAMRSLQIQALLQAGMRGELPPEAAGIIDTLIQGDQKGAKGKGGIQGVGQRLLDATHLAGVLGKKQQAQQQAQPRDAGMSAPGTPGPNMLNLPPVPTVERGAHYTLGGQTFPATTGPEPLAPARTTGPIPQTFGGIWSHLKVSPPMSEADLENLRAKHAMEREQFSQGEITKRSKAQIDAQNERESLNRAEADLFKSWSRGEINDAEYERRVEGLKKLTGLNLKASGLKQVWNQDPDSQTGFRVDYVDPMSGEVRSSAYALPPSGYLPTQGMQIIGMPNPDNPEQMIYQSVPTSRSKVLPGGRGGRGVGQPSPGPSGGAGKPTAGAAGPTSGLPELPGRTLGVAPSKNVQKQITDAHKNWVEVKSRADLMQRLATQAESDPTGATDMLLIGEHIGLIWGYTKGTRMTQAMIHEHIKARPWDQGLQVAWDSITKGKRLSKEQRQAFVAAARDREKAMKDTYDGLRSGSPASSARPKPTTGADGITFVEQ